MGSCRMRGDPPRGHSGSWGGLEPGWAASTEAQRSGRERSAHLERQQGVTGAQGVWGDTKRQGLEGHCLDPGLHP